MNRISRLAATLPLLVAAVARAGDLEDGKALQQAGKFEEALPKFQAAAAADPTDADAALGLSQVLSGLGRYDDAAKAVDAARKAHPENASLPAAKGRAFFLAYVKADAAGEERDDNTVEMYRSGAEKWLGVALTADVKNVEALLTRGQLWMKAGDEEKAGPLFEQAAAADPKNFDAVFALADFWYGKANGDKRNMELWAKASAGFSDALRLDPKSARAALNLARCMAWSKSPSSAVAAAYIKAAELAPDDDTAMSAAYPYVPKTERVATYQKLADALPKNVRRKLFLAYALMEDKQFEKAIEVNETAARLEPKNPYVFVTEGDIRLAWGKIDDAIDNYGEAASLFDKKIDDKTFNKLGHDVGWMNRNLTQAQREKLWSILYANFPDRAWLWNNIGLSYRDAKPFGVQDFKKSLEWYLRAAKAAPDDVCILNDTGLIYQFHMNDFEKAEPYYRKAVEIGRAKGYDCQKGVDPDRGFRDAINNLHTTLVALKKWSELKKFAENDVPDSHPLRDAWIKEAEEKKQ